MQPTNVRQSNQRAVLTAIGIEPGLSNADLARRTGLAPQTVSAVLADLEEAGLLVRGDVRRGRRGQPATPLYINPEGAYAIGVEIGWQHVEVVLIGMGTTGLVAEHRRNYGYPDATTIFDEVAGLVAAMVARIPADKRDRLVGIGLAAPGGIGDPSYIMLPPPGQTELWGAIDIVDRLAEVTGLSVELFNDGNAACWAEFIAHPTPRPGNFAYLLIDTFIAAGIIAQNRLWEGVTGASANLGSMLVAGRQGKPQFVHNVASLHTLRQRFATIGVELDAGLSAEPPDGAEAILAEWIEDTAFAMAQTILNTVTVIEFHVAIVAAVLPPPVFARVMAAIQRCIVELPNLGRDRPTVIAGHIGKSGAARGAAQLRFYRRFFSRELEHMDG